MRLIDNEITPFTFLAHCFRARKEVKVKYVLPDVFVEVDLEIGLASIFIRFKEKGLTSLKHIY